MKCSKIGIDFHGVINTDPQFFSSFSAELLHRNIEIHIISGGPRDLICQYLQENKISYNIVWCIFDYYEKKDKIMIYDDGSFYVDDELWNKAKAGYCRLNGIDVQIDDSKIYGKYFTTPYCLYDSRTKTGLLHNRKIDFKPPSSKVIDELFSILGRKESF